MVKDAIGREEGGGGGEEEEEEISAGKADEADSGRGVEQAFHELESQTFASHPGQRRVCVFQYELKTSRAQEEPDTQGRHSHMNSKSRAAISQMKAATSDLIDYPPLPEIFGKAASSSTAHLHCLSHFYIVSTTQAE